MKKKREKFDSHKYFLYFKVGLLYKLNNAKNNTRSNFFLNEMSHSEFKMRRDILLIYGIQILNMITCLDLQYNISVWVCDIMKCPSSINIL